MLASSDANLSHLALHLRERGFTVIGMGEAKAPATFRNACHEFCDLSTAEMNRAASPVPDDILARLMRMIEAYDGLIPN